MPHLIRVLAPAMLVLSAVGAARAGGKEDVQELLGRPILKPEQTVSEVQNFCAGRIPPLPQPGSVAEWEKIANVLREQTLQNTVYRGKAAGWRDAPLKVDWQETIPGGPGYRIRKLRYEAVPGMWIPALLYEPDNIAGKVPVFLNVNGHDPVGKATEYKQMRCINQAKRGVIALNVEWVGMGQLRTDGFAHGRMNQLDLCGTSGLAPFYLSMKRGLDILLAHENADPTRVGVAGLSGGGWQTIIISALDTRVTLSNPVAGYSSFITRGKNFSDLGDSEQTPVDLATTADYSHLTALLAPRPTLLTYNLNDNCCFKADHALPPLLAAGRPFFQLYGKNNNLQYHVNAEPGDHNFQKENREALYRMIGLYFFGGDQNFDATEIPSKEEIKTADELRVELPEKNADFNTLALDIAKDLPRDAELDAKLDSVASWQTSRRKALLEIVRTMRSYDAQGEVAGEESKGLFKAVQWKLKLDGDWTIPVVELTRGEPTETVVLVADEGRTSTAEAVLTLLDSGRRVLTVDPFYFGESKLGQRDYLFGLLVSTVGERPLAVQAGQVVAVARWSMGQHKSGPVTLVAHGPRTSLFALVAAAVEEKGVARVELHGSLGSLKEILEQNR
ncbi:MAG: alpha/beta hydrolase family protein, partial [Deltaproteobacteria bacterium]